MNLALPAPRADLTASLAHIAGFALREFGPLIAFWGVNWFFGIKIAIVVSLIVIVGESVWRWWRGEGFTRLYLLISGLTLAFGAIDLSITTPFLLKYEAAVTNFVVGAAFVIGAFGDRPMLQEVAEQRASETFPATAEVRRSFSCSRSPGRSISSPRPPSTPGRSGGCR